MATVIYNCKHCKIGKRVEYPIGNSKTGFFRLATNGVGPQVPACVYIQAIGGGKPTVYAGDTENGLCSQCGRMMSYAPLKGRTNPEHKCDARCMASRGPLCECSCGGANHGKSWAA